MNYLTIKHKITRTLTKTLNLFLPPIITRYLHKEKKEPVYPGSFYVKQQTYPSQRQNSTGELTTAIEVLHHKPFPEVYMGELWQQFLESEGIHGVDISVKEDDLRVTNLAEVRVRL